MDFDEAFSRLIDSKHEGESLSLDQNDHGNWTGDAVGLGQLKGSKYGISAASYPGEDIAALTMDRAAALYKRDFWGPAGCDAAPDALKFDLFDMAVNSGPKAAVKSLQMAVGETKDGILGPRTLQAMQSMSPQRVLARFNGARLNYIADAKGWPAFGRDWVKRIAANLLEA